jgi:DNA-binding NtrC family response regulator
MNAKILVVEDEKAIRLALGGLLRRSGYEVELAENGEQARERLSGGGFDLVLTDLSLGDGASGMDVLAASKQARPEAAVVMITAHGSERIAVQAIARGADDYLPKPFDNDELRLVVARNLARSRLAREHRELLERVARAEALLPPIDPEQVSFSDAKRRVVTAFERAYLLGALRRNGGNVSRTARTIGMVRQSLQQKIREHDLRSEDWKQAS